MAFKRLPNRFGKIVKLSGKRRNPYYPMLWIDEREDPVTYQKKQIYKGLPSQATYSAALRVLTEAHREQETFGCGYTFSEVFDMACAEKYTDEHPMPSNRTCSVKYLEPIGKKRISDLRAADLERTVNADAVPRTLKMPVAGMIRLAFDYAMRHEYIDKNYAEIAHYQFDKAVRVERKLFDPAEVESIMSSVGLSIQNDILAVLIYTGMRQVEAVKIKRSDVHTEERYFLCGVKTDAGKNRPVPIHPNIMPIIEKHFVRSGELNAETLFCDDAGKPLPDTLMMNWIRRHIPGHLSHDCRHTFTSRAAECGMTDIAIDRITGHVSPGITKQVYTHLSIDYLISEIEKLYF